MTDEKPRLTFYRNDSEEHRTLESQLRARGYEVRVITHSGEPVILSSSKMYYHGLRQICDSFHVYPR